MIPPPYPDPRLWSLVFCEPNRTAWLTPHHRFAFFSPIQASHSRQMRTREKSLSRIQAVEHVHLAKHQDANHVQRRDFADGQQNEDKSTLVLNSKFIHELRAARRMHGDGDDPRNHQPEGKRQKKVNKGGFKSLGKTAWYDNYIPKAQVTKVMLKKSTMTTPEKRYAELQASLDTNFDAEVRASKAEFWPSIPMRS